MIGFPLLIWALNILFLGMTIFALVDVVRRPAEAFPAVDRQTKTSWLIFLALSLGILVYFTPVSFLGIMGVVVTMLYLVDVRPRVREITS